MGSKLQPAIRAMVTDLCMECQVGASNDDRLIVPTRSLQRYVHSMQQA